MAWTDEVYYLAGFFVAAASSMLVTALFDRERDTVDLLLIGSLCGILTLGFISGVTHFNWFPGGARDVYLVAGVTIGFGSEALVRLMARLSLKAALTVAKHIGIELNGYKNEKRDGE